MPQFMRHAPERGSAYFIISLKGGIPSAGSPTDTLLRLSSSQKFHPRPLKRTSDAPSSHSLTGGEYKAQEHIQRAIADTRLLANPAS